MSDFNPESIGLLDWRHNSVGTYPAKCRICGYPAFMRDDKGNPCHMTCGQAELDQARDRSATADEYDGEPE